jgi:iron complex transport system substrate-binding protein
MIGARAVRIALVLLAASLAVATPSVRLASAAPLVLTDMLGRRVELAAQPRRIVSLVPSATEIAFALGGDDRIAAVTDFCDFPPEARRKPSVGGMIAPSLEAIVALRPDLVLATDAGNRDETLEQLARLRIPVYVVHARGIAQVMDVIGRIGRLTGREREVAALVAALERRIQAVRALVATLGRPRTLYVLWPEPLIVPARDALVTELIHAAGGASVTAQEAGDYPRFSIEAAVARAPDVIILARHGSGTGPVARDRWDRLAALPAVKRGRVHEVDGSLVHRYGPRMVDGLEQLVRVIHPEAFR